MTIPLLVINLKRSRERWSDLEQAATSLGIDVRRVEGIDGAVIDREKWVDVKPASFHRKHGRVILPGEYGCYRSHLRALEAAAELDAPYSTIVEDDVALSADITIRLQAITEAIPDFDVIKLVNHRVQGFVRKARTREGDEIGRTLHGPLGSAAAYLVSKQGAVKLRRALAVMELPWDIALERYWATGVRFHTVRRNLFAFSAHRGVSTISPGAAYAETKFPAWRRLPAAVFRLQDYGWRCIAALQ